MRGNNFTLKVYNRPDKTGLCSHHHAQLKDRKEVFFRTDITQLGTLLLLQPEGTQHRVPYHAGFNRIVFVTNCLNFSKSNNLLVFL